MDEAIRQLHRYTWAAYHAIEEEFPAQNRIAECAVLADLGVGAQISDPVLAALIEGETDDEWRKDLRSTGMDWIRRVLSVNLDVHLVEVDELIQETDGGLLEDWGVSNPKAYAHYRRSLELRMQGKLYEALAEVEIAARLDPLDPANHTTMGSMKAGIGIARGDSALVNEGLNALWLAVALDSKWILPWTEIGSILLTTGRPESAVEHLRRLKAECEPPDSKYFSVLGKAYWKLNRLPEALDAFEAALELDPEETANLLAVSEIAMVTGDHNKHRKYFRRARHFGADDGTVEMWELLRENSQSVKSNTEDSQHQT